MNGSSVSSNPRSNVGSSASNLGRQISEQLGRQGEGAVREPTSMASLACSCTGSSLRGRSGHAVCEHDALVTCATGRKTGEGARHPTHLRTISSTWAGRRKSGAVAVMEGSREPQATGKGSLTLSAHSLMSSWLQTPSGWRGGDQWRPVERGGASGGVAPALHAVAGTLRLARIHKIQNPRIRMY